MSTISTKLRAILQEHSFTAFSSSLATFPQSYFLTNFTCFALSWKHVNTSACSVILENISFCENCKLCTAWVSKFIQLLRKRQVFQITDQFLCKKLAHKQKHCKLENREHVSFRKDKMAAALRRSNGSINHLGKAASLWDMRLKTLYKNIMSPTISCSSAKGTNHMLQQSVMNF